MTAFPAAEAMQKRINGFSCRKQTAGYVHRHGCDVERNTYKNERHELMQTDLLAHAMALELFTLVCINQCPVKGIGVVGGELVAEKGNAGIVGASEYAGDDGCNDAGAFTCCE